MKDTDSPQLPKFPIDVTYRMKGLNFHSLALFLLAFGGSGAYIFFSGDFSEVGGRIVGSIFMLVAIVFLPALIFEHYFSKGYLLLTKDALLIPKGLLRKGHDIAYRDITGMSFRQGDDEDSDEDRYICLHLSVGKVVEIDREYFKHDHAYWKVVETLKVILKEQPTQVNDLIGQ